MHRREFLRTCSALGITAALPTAALIKSEPGVELVKMVAHHIDEQQIEAACRLEHLTYIESDSGNPVFRLDTEKLWQAITLEDSKGRMWTTKDGEQWTSGRHSLKMSDAVKE